MNSATCVSRESLHGAFHRTPRDETRMFPHTRNRLFAVHRLKGKRLFVYFNLGIDIVYKLSGDISSNLNMLLK